MHILYVCIFYVSMYLCMYICIYNISRHVRDEQLCIYTYKYIKYHSSLFPPPQSPLGVGKYMVSGSGPIKYLGTHI